MSLIQTTIGIGLLAAIGSVVVDVALPDPPRIEIHSISYAAGLVTQDRTVNDDHATYFMPWRATLLDADTGVALIFCSGSGYRDYPTGRRKVTMPLAVWVGNPACTPANLPPGRYEPLAVYGAGIDQVIGRGDVFEVKP